MGIYSLLLIVSPYVYDSYNFYQRKYCFDLPLELFYWKYVTLCVGARYQKVACGADRGGL